MLVRMALIEDGVVANVIDVNPESIPDAFAQAVQCGDEVGVGHTWDGSNFTAPPTPTQQDLEDMAEHAADKFLESTEQDKAIAMTLADMWKFVQQALGNDITIQEARSQVKARVLANLKTLRGL